MGHVLRFERNGSYITLTSGDYSVLEYNPVSSERSVVEAVDVNTDGGVMAGATKRNIAEVIGIRVANATAATLESDLSEITKYLELALEYQKSRAGYPVYLEYQINGAGTVWRSEILAGKLSLGNDAQYTRLKGYVHAAIIIQRMYYWEGAETELALARDGTTKATGGVVIYNHDDSGTNHGNWVTVAGSDVTGSLRTPLKLKITKSTNDANRFDEYWVGGSPWINASIKNSVEGEDATAGGGSDTVDAACSNGYKWSMAVPNEGANTGTWAFTATDIDNFSGRFYKVLGRFPGLVATDIYLTMWFHHSSGLYTWTSFEELNLIATSDYQEIGTVKLPPWKLLTPSDPIHFSVWCRKVGANPATTIYIDNWLFIPVDEFRHFEHRDAGMSYNNSIIDDGITRKTYTLDASNQNVSPSTIDHGNYIHVTPGQDQKIYFAFVVGVDQTATIQAWFRPRKEIL